MDLLSGGPKPTSFGFQGGLKQVLSALFFALGELCDPPNEREDDVVKR